MSGPVEPSRPAGPLPVHGRPDSAERVDGLIRDVLRSVHARGSLTAIDGATGGNAAFPGASVLSTGVQPLVVDANWLRGDVLHATRHGRQTVMLTAANQNVIRLFCAPHVVDEVEEHHAEWTDRRDVDAAAFLACWRGLYLPLLRVVTPPDGALSGPEAARIEELRRQDPDDVPSAILALVLGAPFISADRYAVRAVHGAARTSSGHAELLALLRDASDAGLMRELATGAAAASAATLHGLVGLVGLVARSGPLVFVPLTLGAVWAGRRGPRGARRRLAEAAVETTRMAGCAAVFYRGLTSRVDAATPPQPCWTDLAVQCPADAVLTRACIRAAARAARSHVSPAELAASLPGLGLAQHERAVRAALRTLRGSAFEEVHRGRWQVGRCAAPVWVP